jgi:hypothetical protein
MRVRLPSVCGRFVRRPGQIPNCICRKSKRLPSGSRLILLTKTKLRDEREIARLIDLFQIIEQRPAGVDQHQKTAT